MGWVISAGGATRGWRPRSATSVPSARRARRAWRTVWRLTPYCSVRASSPGKRSAKSPALIRARSLPWSCCQSGVGADRSNVTVAITPPPRGLLNVRTYPTVNVRTFSEVIMTATAIRVDEPNRTRRTGPGLAVALAVAAVATVAGTFVPVVGGPVFGIVLGAVAANAVRALRDDRLARGYEVAARPVLQLSIVVLGTGL